MYLDSRRVTREEFVSEFGEEYNIQASVEFFRFGANGGAYRDNNTGEVIIVNLPHGEYSELEQYKLMIEFCGKPGQFTEIEFPKLHGIDHYEDDLRSSTWKGRLIWASLVIFGLGLPLTLSAMLYLYLVG